MSRHDEGDLRGKSNTLRFSKWSAFYDRDSLKDTRFPGVYALAISKKNIAGMPFKYSEEIAYFGMTNSKLGIRGRLNQFNDTIRRKRDNHGGAQRFSYDYKDGETLAKRLYVAICPFKCDVTSIARKDLETMGLVAHAEYVALANYAARFRRLPKYNDKKNSPKTDKSGS